MSLTVAAAISIGNGVAIHQGRLLFIKDHQQIWQDMGKYFDEVLEVTSNKALAQFTTTTWDIAAPYTRSVESERQRLNKLIVESEDILATFSTLWDRSNKLRTF